MPVRDNADRNSEKENYSIAIKMETNSAKPIIWAVSDGRAGNVAMAMGLAERLAALSDGHIVQINQTVSGPRAWLAARMPWLPSQLQIATYPQPTVVIGAGRRIAPSVAGMRRSGARVIQILNPQMALRHFDLVIAPEHDGLQAPNTLATLGSVHRISPQQLTVAQSEWAARFASLPQPRIAVLIGGSTKRTSMTDAMATKLAKDLRILADQGAGLMITASRRTPEYHAKEIAASVPEADFWDGTGKNPYFGMLACADALIVTDDSVNMASEAAATGKPVAIYPLLREQGKIARFHKQLIEAGHAQWFDGNFPTAHAEPLDETGRAAARVAALL